MTEAATASAAPAGFSATVGCSRVADPAQAGREAARAALESNPSARLALVFSSISCDQGAVARGVAEGLGEVPFVGGSSVGEIGPAGYHTGSVVVVALSGPFSFSFAVEPYGTSPKRATLKVANDCMRAIKGRRFDLALLFCSTEGAQASAVVDTLKDAIGEHALIFGGCNGYKWEPPSVVGDSHQYTRDRLVTKGIALVLLAFEDPQVRVVTTFSHGLQPISNPMVCTRAEGHWVHEVNGQPIFDFYEKYLGKRIEDVGAFLPTYPLLVHVEGEEQTLVHLPFFLDRERGRIGFQPMSSMEGQTVSLATFSRDEILRACRESAYNAKVMLAELRPKLVLAVSCGARQMFLGTRVGEEAELLSEVFGPGVPVAGFYSAGEVTPVGTSRPGQVGMFVPANTEIVTETFCILAIGDRSRATASVQAAGPQVGALPEVEEPVEARLQKARAEVETLRSRIKESDALLDFREQVLMKTNRENIDLAHELRTVNLHLSELNQKNSRLLRMIKQYTPQTTWKKAGKLVEQGRLEIPDEAANLTYLFLDVKGFTSFSENHSPREVIDSLNHVFVPCTDVIYSYGGDVHKFIGDAIFAIFESAEDAVSAAIAICREVRAARSPFSVRIGIHSGKSIHGNVGSEIRKDNTLIGDAVNMAQRLESNCVPGRVLVSRRVYEEVAGPLGLTGQPRTISVKGKSESIEVYDLDPGDEAPAS